MRGCHYHSMYHSASLRSDEGCHYHLVYHSAGWRSGSGVTTTQCVTVQAAGQVRGVT